MVVVFAWYETAYHKISSLKSLVYRRRLMHPTGDGFKIMYRKYERIVASVPAYSIKGMIGIMIRIKHIVTLDIDEKVSFLIMRLEILRASDVALAVWRMLQ
jgi:hypothetical protein